MLNRLFGACCYVGVALVLPVIFLKTEMPKVVICLSCLRSCSFCDMRQSRKCRNLVNITLYYAEEIFEASDTPNPHFHLSQDSG